jgi:hypothetical protein
VFKSRRAISRDNVSTFSRLLNQKITTHIFAVNASNHSSWNIHFIFSLFSRHKQTHMETLRLVRCAGTSWLLTLVLHSTYAYVYQEAYFLLILPPNPYASDSCFIFWIRNSCNIWWHCHCFMHFHKYTIVFSVFLVYLCMLQLIWIHMSIII